MSKPYEILNIEYYLKDNRFLDVITEYKRNYSQTGTRELQLAFSKDSLKDGSFEQNLDKAIKMLSENKVNLGNIKIVIRLAPGSQDKTFTPQEWKTFVDCSKKYEKMGVDFSVNDIGENWSIKDVENANSQIDKSVASIKQKNLSPLEQLMAAYLSVKKRKYTKEDPNQSPAQSRSIYGVLNSDKIVCVGYAELFTQIINQVGDKNIQIFSNTVDSVHDNGFVGGHRNLIVKVKDEKYGVDGFYYLDPTWDSGNARNMSYFMVPIKDIKSIKTKIRYRRASGVSIGAQGAKFSDELIDFLLKDPTFKKLAEERIAQKAEKENSRALEKAMENYEKIDKFANYIKSKGVKYATHDCFLNMLPVYAGIYSEDMLYKKADEYVADYKQKVEKTKGVFIDFVKQKLYNDCLKTFDSKEEAEEEFLKLYPQFLDAFNKNPGFIEVVTCVDSGVIANYFEEENFAECFYGGFAEDYLQMSERFFKIYADELDEDYVSYTSGYGRIEDKIAGEVEDIKLHLRHNGSDFYDILEEMGDPLPLNTLQNALYEVLKKANPDKPKEVLFNAAKQAMEYNVNISKKHFSPTAKNAFAETTYY